MTMIRTCGTLFFNGISWWVELESYPPFRVENSCTLEEGQRVSVKFHPEDQFATIIEPAEEKVELTVASIVKLRAQFAVFDIEMPRTLDRALAAFVADGGQTLENQAEVRRQMMTTLLSHPSNIFKAEPFTHIRDQLKRGG